MRVWLVAALVISVMAAGCGKSGNDGSSGSEVVKMPNSPGHTAATESDQQTPIQRLMSVPTYTEALAMTLPQMTDADNQSSVGASALAIWAAQHLQLADVQVATNETSVKLVAKDSDAARGKRMCIRGDIIQIAKEKDAEGQLYVGLMRTGGWNLIHFYAARSSGDLVENSSARFCGVVTGRYDYDNSAGGKGHAIELVGVFDLPENRAARPAAAATTAPAPVAKRRALRCATDDDVKRLEEGDGEFRSLGEDDLERVGLKFCASSFTRPKSAIDAGVPRRGRADAGADRTVNPFEGGPQ